MAITALPTPPTRSDPATFAARGDAFLAALPTFATEANALQLDVNTKQGEVAASVLSIEADADQTALDRIATAADRVQTGLDVVAAAAQAASALASEGIATTKASEAFDSAANAEAARAAAVVAQNNAVSVVTGGTGSLTAAPSKLPLASATGQLDISWLAAISGVKTNDIGVPGQAGFGVGICPAVPAGYTPLPGCTDKLSANYGNYQYSDGSIVVWVPAYWLRIGHAGNPTYGAYGVNSQSIVPISTYPDNTTANAEGFYRHRAFINGGTDQLGFFRDKYDASQNGTIASSILNAIPMVSGPASEASTAIVAARVYTILSVGTTDFTLIGAASNTVGLRFTATGVGSGTGTVSQQVGFVGCTANGQTPANAYYGALQAARSRGNKFFAESVFIADALSRISEAHAQAATSTTYCAWYDATGVRNFPKGNDNNALKSEADVTLNGAGAVTFTSAGATTYPNFAKTGSGSVFARTTHNGQACGVADVAGNIYKINPGMTCIATSKAITAATKANPCALTVVAHGRTTGDYVQIDSVGGMTQLNGKIYKVTTTGLDTLTLDAVDSSAFGTYTSGGTVINGTFYTLKESVDIATVTSGTTLATDHWGATGVAAQFDAVTMNFATTYPNNAYAQRFGNAANAVFDMSTANGRVLTMLGMPAAAGMSTAGSNAMGLDYYYQYIRDQLCVISRGNWGNGSFAGSRVRRLHADRAVADNYVGFACASYL